MMTPGVLAAIGPENLQSADAPAKCVALFMADGKRHGESVFVERGEYLELEGGEEGYRQRTAGILGIGVEGDPVGLRVEEALKAEGRQ